MSATKTRLVLHLAGVTQPVQVSLTQTTATELQKRLTELMAQGEVLSLDTADGGQFMVNFTHVATAHITAGRIEANSYGEPSRAAGFGT